MIEMNEQYRAEMYEAGLVPPDRLVIDSRIHRFSSSGRQMDKAGWYVMYPGESPIGAFGCWRSGCSGLLGGRLRSLDLHLQRRLLQRARLQAACLRDVPQHTQWAKNAERNAALMAQSEPAGAAVRGYLEARGLAAWSIPSSIRQHSCLPYWEVDEYGKPKKIGVFPAMLAPIVRNGQLLAVHRTYLDDGKKADVPQPKKLTPASGALAGSSIELSEASGGVIAIAEGIETAAAAALGSGLPVVAAYCASALARFSWPRGVQRIVIMADNDAAGDRAARALADRADRAGVRTLIVTPSKYGADWADVWKEGQL